MTLRYEDELHGGRMVPYTMGKTAPDVCGRVVVGARVNVGVGEGVVISGGCRSGWEIPGVLVPSLSGRLSSQILHYYWTYCGGISST